VLILGENGTGKEVAANFFYINSRRFVNLSIPFSVVHSMNPLLKENSLDRKKELTVSQIDPI